MSNPHDDAVKNTQESILQYTAQIHAESMNHCHLDVSLFSVKFTVDAPHIDGDRTTSTTHVQVNFGDMNRDLMDCLKFGIEKVVEPVPGLKQIILDSWQKKYDSLIR